jgi:hypothetical protein
MVIKKKVIKDVPEDMELENLTQQLNSGNENKNPITFQVIDAVTLKMKVKETSEGTKEEKLIWKESRAVCLSLELRNCSLTNVFDMKIEVSTFVAAVR